jgi:hypothetical protein
MVALLLIGMLDCARTQIVVESLLKEIVTSGAEFQSNLRPATGRPSR